MATSKSAQLANFTQDILGRYICNGFDEAMDSMDNNRPPQAQSDARLFNALTSGALTACWRGISIRQDQQLPNSRSGGRTAFAAEAFPESSPAAATYTEMASEMQSAIGQRRRVTALKQRHSCLE